MAFSISIIRDINEVITSDDAQFVMEDGTFFVSHKYRNHNIITKFEGDGVMCIYDATTANINDLSNLKSNNSIVYDTHWNEKNPKEGYRAKLRELCGE